MKSKSGIQMSAHPAFHDAFKKVKAQRVIMGKEKLGELSDKRLFLTLAKVINENIGGIRDILLNANIDLREQ